VANIPILVINVNTIKAKAITIIIININDEEISSGHTPVSKDKEEDTVQGIVKSVINNGYVVLHPRESFTAWQ